MDRMSALTDIEPYVREFVGKVFVVKIGGEICTTPHLENVAAQISLLHHLGIRIILVHGGGPQMDELLHELRLTPHKVAGQRVTDAPTLRAAKMAFNGVLNTDIVAALSIRGAGAVGLSGADGGLIIARKRPPAEVAIPGGPPVTVDYGFVGDVVTVNPRLVETLLNDGFIPVICSLGLASDGAILNINADTVAAEIARAVLAAKLIILSNVPGLLRDRSDTSTLISTIDLHTLEELRASGAITDGMLPKIEACISAIRRGVPRTHLLDGTRAAPPLLELFSDAGSGTTIVADNDSQGRRSNQP